ncbi:trypsin-like peptidase domain-containing protein [Flavobacterium silvaticum]|uniref:PDZ domain-containing protein n=1 Tax=Flavobacterium silvaticum TaxID=1852020 RepID=A0A972FUU3_9FLAO|nr:trypsin-like peptidase domain-containing protein [Flavobacterium silvaticum]NMH28025.1 PDZ domain-containing protein [Flavobacterium silvaticum]
MKRFSRLFLVALLSGATTLGAYKLLSNEDFFDNKKSITTSAPENYSRNVSMGGAETVDFTQAADKAVHYVVHVKNTSYRTVSNPMMEYFYGYRGGQQQEQVGTGSGVIISEDGYIVTNNHVIQGASELEVTLNNKQSYKAKLIGTDSKMDIALLKIDADGKLPYTTFANSDDIKVGEWVLAVGNPYNLTSTVTAGIVSAKARNLANDGIQSFIQTDAAVNPGNSGGALVNTHGELVGINTMISSMTGSYVGYSFAVPSNIARKIIEDIMEYGNVQRAVMGIRGAELNSAASKELKVSQTQGFYVGEVTPKSGAEKAGIEAGDVIVDIDKHTISSYADFTGVINTKRPNDIVQVTYIRDGKTYSTPVKLIKNDYAAVEFKGMSLSNLSAAEKKKFRTQYGVKIEDVNNERLAQYTEELKGGVILSIGNVKVSDVESVGKLIDDIDDNQSVQVQLITAQGEMVRVIL